MCNCSGPCRCSEKNEKLKAELEAFKLNNTIDELIKELQSLKLEVKELKREPSN
jgi:cell division protein FtsL